MISKKLRLTEREVKKVLQKGKPFFSHWIVVNFLWNTLAYNRFAIVIWTKSVNTNVTRVFFRRRFFDYIQNGWIITLTPSQGLNDFEAKEEWTVPNKGFRVNNTRNKDYVFVVKKKLQLDRKKIELIGLFDKDLKFLLKKIK